MKKQLSIQEKLWELRKERKLKLEDVAKAVDISPATLSNYENNEYKDVSLSLLIKLAKYYQVSLDWLAGLSEAKEPQNIAVSELLLDDATLELLKNAPFNHRLLCEIIKHPHFLTLMVHTEIYVDGVATLRIKILNKDLEVATNQLIQQHHPHPYDLQLNTLEKGCIQEDEYFFHTIHNDFDTILRTIRKNHQYDADSFPIEVYSPTSEQIQQFAEMVDSSETSIDACIHSICDFLEINYDTLPKEEYTALKKTLQKSKHLQTIPNHKNKGRR